MGAGQVACFRRMSAHPRRMSAHPRACMVAEQQQRTWAAGVCVSNAAVDASARNGAALLHHRIRFHGNNKKKRANKLLEREEIRNAKKPKNLVQADYKTRGLDFCYYCGQHFNVGEKIPRILIHCGHTFCTECLNILHH